MVWCGVYKGPRRHVEDTPIVVGKRDGLEFFFCMILESMILEGEEKNGCFVLDSWVFTCFFSAVFFWGVVVPWQILSMLKATSVVFTGRGDLEGVHNPILRGRKRSPWLLTTYPSPGMGAIYMNINLWL